MVAWPYPLSACCLLSGTVRHDSTGPGAFARRQPHACTFVVQRRRTGLPGSWETPVWTCPALRPRRPFPAKPYGRVVCLPAFENCRRLPLPQFRGSITRPIHSLCTLRSGGYPTPATLAAGWWLALAGWDFHPLGFTTSFPPSRFPGCPGFAWRTQRGGSLDSKPLEPGCGLNSLLRHIHF
jgi:hypothetical protein